MVICLAAETEPLQIIIPGGALQIGKRGRIPAPFYLEQFAGYDRMFIVIHERADMVLDNSPEICQLAVKVIQDFNF